MIFMAYFVNVFILRHSNSTLLHNSPKAYFMKFVGSFRSAHLLWLTGSKPFTLTGLSQAQLLILWGVCSLK